MAENVSILGQQPLYGKKKLYGFHTPISTLKMDQTSTRTPKILKIQGDFGRYRDLTATFVQLQHKLKKVVWFKGKNHTTFPTQNHTGAAALPYSGFRFFEIPVIQLRNHLLARFWLEKFLAI